MTNYSYTCQSHYSNATWDDCWENEWHWLIFSRSVSRVYSLVFGKFHLYFIGYWSQFRHRWFTTLYIMYEHNYCQQIMIFPLKTMCFCVILLMKTSKKSKFSWMYRIYTLAWICGKKWMPIYFQNFKLIFIIFVAIFGFERILKHLLPVLIILG